MWQRQLIIGEESAVAMKILQKDAEEIVGELSKLVGLKINIVGSDAIIIANSDPERVGDFHEATDKIIKNNLEELIAASDTQYKGTHSGTNLPIVIDGKIIGVVGITGPLDKAKSYGKIIKKMTEIMLQSRAEEDRLRSEQLAKERYLTSWVCSSQTIITDAFISQGSAYGIDITQSYRIIAVSRIKEDNACIIDMIRRLVQRNHAADNVFLTSHMVVAVLAERSDSRILELANTIVAELDKQGIEVYIGTDNGYHSFTEIHQQYEKAKIALHTGFRLRNKRVIQFDDLNLELILNEVPIEAKVRYIKKIYGGFSLSEIEWNNHIISVLYQEDGSIKKAAKRLILHPNTLQYQLKKIEERTGYDPRKPKYASIFSIASLFITELGDSLANYCCTS